MTQQPTTLYIIGNGFDLLHGVKSSYFLFREYIRKRDKALSFEMDTYFECENFWGDFENNLAFLSREMVMESVDTMLDTYMDTFDEDDDDFSYADYFAAIEMGTQVIPELLDNLPMRFKQWIKTLYPQAGMKEALDMLFNHDALYLNFNYTEFLETLYGVPKNNILYIHGDRRDQKKKLIIGHGRDPSKDFADWYERNKGERRFNSYRRGRKGRRYGNDSLTYLTYFNKDEGKGNWRNPIRYYAADNAAGTIESYFENSAKNTKEIITDNLAFFHSLKGMKEIVVIGHSLSPVDHPYFRKIIEENIMPDKLHWKISWYSDADKDRIRKFSSIMGINEQNIEMFNLR
ncbi:bacteriophage abortive infection AbiH family protein [Siminovitchia fortis]|uniref:bacteriophage abortive infection AbiH family protein n=1 Tax=Siminovitchia fortis TaxID=254758 RepID=UPI0011A0B938|nr:bacteriophage abortive infection AbiH family protein [Siminovitchia fortis]